MGKSSKGKNIDRQQVLELAKAIVAKGQPGQESGPQRHSPLELQTMQLLSIIYAPTSKTAIASCLNRCGIRNQDGRQFLTSHVEFLLAPLLREKMVLLDQLGYRLRPDLCHRFTLAAIQAGQFAQMAAVVDKEIAAQTNYDGSRYYRFFLQAVRDIRLAVYHGNSAEAWKALKICQTQFPDECANQHPFLLICEPFDLPWLGTLPLDIYLNIMTDVLFVSLNSITPKLEAFAHFENRFRSEGGRQFPYARLVLATELILRGRFSEARELVHGEERTTDQSIQAWLEFLYGNDAAAIAGYEKSLGMLKKELGKRKYFFTDFAGIFFIPALLRTGNPDYLRQAEEHASFVAGKREWNFHATIFLFSQLLAARRGVSSAPVTIVQWTAHLVRHGSPIQVLFALLVQLWSGGSEGKALAAVALPKIKKLAAAGYLWLADELALVCNALGTACATEEIEKRREQDGIVPLYTLLSRRDSWEAALTALTSLGSGSAKQGTGAAAGESRLIWVVTGLVPEMVDIQPKEQKRTASGWTSGRVVSLKKLKEGAATILHLTPQDRKICAGILKEKSYYYRQSQENHRIEQTTALPLLIGHPLAFVDDGDLLPLEIVAGEPELRVQREKDKLRLTVVPLPEGKERSLFLWETRTRLKVIEITDRFRKVAEIIGEGLTVPLSAEKQVLESIGAVSSLVTVHSDIGGGASLDERPADSTPLLLLTPYGDGLRLELKVRPLGDEGPLFVPGSGGANIIAELAGKRVQARRELVREQAAADGIVARLPLVAAEEEADGVWLFHEPTDCLELLGVLQSLEEGSGRVLWPEGEKLRVSKVHDASGLRITGRQSGDWFQLDGSLTLDDGEVLELRQLMELLQQRIGRFLPLGDGRFLSLTDQFRRRLEELQSCSEKHGKGVRCALPALAVMEELAEEAGEFKMDKAWQKRLARLREAETLTPTLPSTLQADLREYQHDGFVWLSRLAHWGAGACLADDMGLGKTIQALAVILARAPGGPTLVAAPTSVCMNWEAEALRFAPTLNPLTFGPGNRQEMLASLQPFDLLICSYGLLQQEAELFGQVEWQTIVLDEAQAIKNMATKRSQAAMTLKGGFRLITTGTPVENHLGELWNLFRFINPGLLGSHQAFNDRFAGPIEKNSDKGARERLKKLIRPFTLRRTKAQVLTELPPRTEITLRVELSSEEQAFYEAVRRNALERIEGATGGPAGDKRFRILAEIMRLRRACCHPRLVMPESSLSGAKLGACLELIEELLDNNHKALVFSQFVDHLAIVRAELDRRKIFYQYLDGSTLPPERKKRVEAFQAGEGELFLISLKAGGTGLNLTAADYVIHLDPWWNPAVEDQASDRAHRIGQSRPVTVYRLVAKGSIEEKIIALHQTKRDLADSLLEGTESGARLSADDLLELLREG